MSYPNLTWDRVTAGASVGTAWANQLQTGLWAIQNDIHSAKWNASTLATYIAQVIAADGTLQAMSHAALSQVGDSQHHNKLHADTHTDTPWVEIDDEGDAGLHVAHGRMYKTRNELMYYSTTGTGWIRDTGIYSRGEFATDPTGEYLFTIGGLAPYVHDLYGKFSRSADWEHQGKSDIDAMIVFDGYIWVAVDDDYIYRRPVASGEWENTSEGIGPGYTKPFGPFAVFDSNLYVCQSIIADQEIKIYRYYDPPQASGSNWSLKETISTTSFYPLSMEEFDSYFYLSTRPDALIYRSSDGSTWAEIKDFGGIPAGQDSVSHLTVFGDYLYAYVNQIHANYGFYRTANGSDWAKVLSDRISGAAEYGGRFFALSLTAFHRMETGDLIQAASTAQHGLLPAAEAGKLAAIATRATSDEWSVSGYYTGDGSTVFTAVVGFRPAWVAIQEVSAVHNVWEAFDTATYAFQHKVGGLGHDRPKASETIKITNSGFAAWGSQVMNKQDVTYFFTAIKES